MVGVLPVGILFGTLSTAADLPPLATQALSLFIYTGGAQFVAINLMATDTPAVVVVLAMLIINLRHMLYSASLAPHIRKLSTRWRLGLGLLLSDEAYVVASYRYQQPDITHAHWYTLSSALCLWGAWQAGTAIGISFGSVLPGQSLLDFALPLTLLTLLTPLITNRALAASAFSAGIISLLARTLPYGTGLLLAVILGAVVGIYAEARMSAPDPREERL